MKRNLHGFLRVVSSGKKKHAGQTWESVGATPRKRQHNPDRAGMPVGGELRLVYQSPYPTGLDCFETKIMSGRFTPFAPENSSRHVTGSHEHHHKVADKLPHRLGPREMGPLRGIFLEISPTIHKLAGRFLYSLLRLCFDEILYGPRRSQNAQADTSFRNKDTLPGQIQASQGVRYCETTRA